jgi:hypothetical protein
MAAHRLSARHLVFAAALVGAAASGPAVAATGALTAHSAPTIVADSGSCTNTSSTGSVSLACSPGSTSGVFGLPSEQDLTVQNMYRLH